MNMSIVSPHFGRGRKQLNGSLASNRAARRIPNSSGKNQTNIKNQRAQIDQYQEISFGPTSMSRLFSSIGPHKVGIFAATDALSPVRVPGSRVSSRIPVPQPKYETRDRNLICGR